MLLLACLAVGAGCAQRTAEGARVPAPRPDLITREEIERQHWASAYELVATLRPNWLHERGQDTFGTPVELQVHFNSIRLGGPAMLRETPATELAYLQYFDPLAASARWGLGYSKGAIVLSTKPL